MKTFDKFLSYVAVICALVLVFMLISSASSYGDVADGSDVYKPYVPVDYIEFKTNYGQIYTLDMTDVFRILDGYTGGGLDTDVLLPLSGYGTENIYVQLNLAIMYSSNIPYLRTRIMTDQLPEFGTSDGWELTIVASDYVIANNRINSNYIPRFEFVGLDSSETVDFYSSNRLFYYNKGFTKNEFRVSESYSWTNSWNGTNVGNPACFRLRNTYDNFLAKNTDSNTYIKNESMWVDETYSTVSCQYEVSSIGIMIPYVPEGQVPSIRNYVNLFDLGKLESVIQTTIVTVPGETLDVPDFTTWLTKSVASFMDFGFWGISIAGILAFIVGFKMIKALLDFFAGG